MRPNLDHNVNTSPTVPHAARPFVRTSGKLASVTFGAAIDEKLIQITQPSNKDRPTRNDRRLAYYCLLPVGLGDLTHELGPRHVHGPVDLAGLWSPIVLQDFHHQGRVVRDNNTSLKHAQKPDLALGLTEGSRGIDRYIRVQPLAYGSDCRKSRTDFQRDAGEDQLLATGRRDGASPALVAEGVD